MVLLFFFSFYNKKTVLKRLSDLHSVLSTVPYKDNLDFRSSLYFIRLSALGRESRHFCRISKTVLSIRLVTGLRLNSIYALFCWLIGAMILLPSYSHLLNKENKSYDLILRICKAL